MTPSNFSFTASMNPDLRAFCERKLEKHGLNYDFTPDIPQLAEQFNMKDWVIRHRIHGFQKERVASYFVPPLKSLMIPPAKGEILAKLCNEKLQNHGENYDLLRDLKEMAQQNDVDVSLVQQFIFLYAKERRKFVVSENPMKPLPAAVRFGFLRKLEEYYQNRKDEITPSSRNPAPAIMGAKLQEMQHRKWWAQRAEAERQHNSYWPEMEDEKVDLQKEFEKDNHCNFARAESVLETIGSQKPPREIIRWFINKRYENEKHLYLKEKRQERRKFMLQRENFKFMGYLNSIQMDYIAWMIERSFPPMTVELDVLPGCLTQAYSLTYKELQDYLLEEREAELKNSEEFDNKKLIVLNNNIRLRLNDVLNKSKTPITTVEEMLSNTQDFGISTQEISAFYNRTTSLRSIANDVVSSVASKQQSGIKRSSPVGPVGGSFAQNESSFMNADSDTAQDAPGPSAPSGAKRQRTDDVVNLRRSTRTKQATSSMSSTISSSPETSRTTTRTRNNRALMENGQRQGEQGVTAATVPFDNQNPRGQEDIPVQHQHNLIELSTEQQSNVKTEPSPNQDIEIKKEAVEELNQNEVLVKVEEEEEPEPMIPCLFYPNNNRQPAPPNVLPQSPSTEYRFAGLMYPLPDPNRNSEEFQEQNQGARVTGALHNFDHRPARPAAPQQQLRNFNGNSGSANAHFQLRNEEDSLADSPFSMPAQRGSSQGFTSSPPAAQNGANFTLAYRRPGPPPALPIPQSPETTLTGREEGMEMGRLRNPRDGFNAFGLPRQLHALRQPARPSAQQAGPQPRGRLNLPNNGQIDSSLWTPEDVMEWASRFLLDDQLEVLQIAQLNGIVLGVMLSNEEQCARIGVDHVMRHMLNGQLNKVKAEMAVLNYNL